MSRIPRPENEWQRRRRAQSSLEAEPIEHSLASLSIEDDRGSQSGTSSQGEVDQALIVPEGAFSTPDQSLFLPPEFDQSGVQVSTPRRPEAGRSSFVRESPPHFERTRLSIRSHRSQASFDELRDPNPWSRVTSPEEQGNQGSNISGNSSRRSSQQSVRRVRRVPMTSRPPRRGARDAPKFDGTEPLELPRFFDDIEYIATECNLTDTEKIRYTKYYASTATAELWETADEVKSTANDWGKAKEAIVKFYPSLSPGVRYTRADLEGLVEDWRVKGFSARADLAEFHNEFVVRSRYLESNGVVSPLEKNRMFARAFTGEFRDRLRQRLEVKAADPGPGKPYEVGTVFEHAEHILAGSSFDDGIARKGSTTPVPTVKTEDTGSLWETIKNLQVQVEMLGRRPQGSGGMYRSPGCNFCGETSHFVRSCPRVVEYEQAGKCQRTPEGRVVLSNGGFIPMGVPGSTIKERIDNYLGSEAASRPVNMIDWAGSDYLDDYQDMLYGSASTYFASESTGERTEGVPSVGMVGTVETDEEAEVARLEIMLADARKKASAVRKAKFDGVEVPRLSSTPAGQSQGRNQAQPQTRSVPQPDKPQDRGQVPPVPKQYPKQDVTQGPQYRYVAPIEDSSTVQKVLARSLDATVTVTNRELLAISSEIRKQIKELTTTKRYAAGEVNLVTAGEETPGEGTETMEGAQPVFFGDVPAAVDTLPLRTLKVWIEDTVEAEAILDQGAVVCVIREDVWERLGVHMRSDRVMTMESADSGRSSTLGVIQDAKFAVAGIEVKLQIHVVRQAPFEVLLGRPFFSITECETKDFVSGDQHITLTDPRDRNRRCKVATGIRTYARVAEQQGFAKSRN